ncbi:hypothetical protein NUU61_002859 [Penicillium alfredii]|uniref:Uncharacterized protein n=1 Tax=Penicillium alfredii TaxID=1506179 RepID=A0A9W9KHM8_9EURO|nr:uncharacterized protein NUU61_002859 [Penicillium alfredii]KAJ5105512.1 hypothetical protein NUU61_002859 [Penicillium alfredii]
MPVSSTKDRVTGAEPTADVARILDNAQVPHVLWGRLAFGLEIEFVIPDDHLESATNTLSTAGFPRCTNPNRINLGYGRARPVPDIHFHIELRYPDCTVLSLLAKPVTLW